MFDVIKWVILVINLVISSLTAGNTAELKQKTEKPSVTPVLRQNVNVVRVIDGDTIEIEGGQKVRYIGMDAPETVDWQKAIGCFGEEASLENKKLVEGKEIEMEKDISETDKYGRLLRYVWQNGTMINETLVRGGYARLETIPPDVKYGQVFLAAENEARKKGLGLWKKCRQK